ncbi:MAG: flagellar filament capping protein FliD [Thermotogae bacterium]|nr:flagellar filament capping protein FliD [Thermotogota bacterium]
MIGIQGDAGIVNANYSRSLKTIYSFEQNFFSSFATQAVRSSLNTWDTIKGNAITVNNAISPFVSEMVFSPIVSYGDGTGRIDIQITSLSDLEEQSHTITVQQLAKPFKFEGKSIYQLGVTSSSDALGIIGSFSINSYEFTVASSDSMLDILQKLSQDENGNSLSDVISLNVSLSNGRLVFESTQPGSNVSLSDPQFVLYKLGIVDEKNDIAHIIQSPITSVIYVDGKRIERRTNEIKDAIKGVTIRLRSIISTPISIEIKKPVNTLADEIETFVNKFNSLMRTIDSSLRNFTQMQALHAVNLKYDLLEDIFEPVDNYNVQKVGITLKGLVKDVVKGGPTVKGNDFDLSENQVIHSAKTSNVYSSLEEIGITEGEDGYLSFDKTKFKDVYRNYPQTVARIFDKDKGFAIRLHSTLEDAVKEKTGMIDLMKASILSGLNDIQKYSLYTKYSYLNEYKQSLSEQLIS